VLSPQKVLYCNDNTDCSASGSYCQQGCNGGYLDLAWAHLKNVGTVSLSCVSYQNNDYNAASCPAQCNNAAQSFNEFQAHDFYRVVASPTMTVVEAMQRELLQYGPLQVAFYVYADFLSYNSGVYVKSSSDNYGGHAVAIVGWGVDNGVDYWVCRNSWSTSFGESGYFRIRRGTDEAGIESFVYTGRPVASGITYDPIDGSGAPAALHVSVAAMTAGFVLAAAASSLLL
jgi:cathepsin B